MAEDGEYSATVPAEAGTYGVKAVLAETANYKAAESKPISFVIAAQTKPETGLSGGALAGIIIAVAIVAIAFALFALFIFRKDKSIGLSDFYKKLWKRIVKGRTESIKEAEFPAEENEIDEDDKRE